MIYLLFERDSHFEQRARSVLSCCLATTGRRRLTNDAAAANVSAAIPGCGFQRGERHDLPPSLVEDTVAHKQHAPAEPLRQRFLGHKGNRRYLASIELIDAAENGT
jgi:hypothetical protein